MSKKKDLYVSKSYTIEELTKMITNTTPLLKTRNARILLQSADKVLPDAEKLYQEGDEEMAYVRFMCYLELVSAIHKTPEFEKDKAYYIKMIGAKKIKDTYAKCEALNSSLIARYSMVKEAENLEKVEKEKEMLDATENENQRLANEKNSKLNAVKLPAGINGVIKPVNCSDKETKNFAGDITVADLKNVMEQKCSKLILFDCRSNSSFNGNHVDHPNCISIPDDILERGQSAAKITDKLKMHYPESYFMWAKRHGFDLVVLYDWRSSFSNMSDRMQVLYDAITKWETVKYKSVPVILQGGMRSMYYSYPTLLTNPSITVNEENKKTDKIQNSIKNLDLISYPNLDYEESPERPSPAITSPGIHNDISMDSHTHSNSHSSNNLNSNHQLTIDRSKKPQPRQIKVTNGNEPTAENSPQAIFNGVENEDDKRHAVKPNDSISVKANAETVNAALDKAIVASQLAIDSEKIFATLKQDTKGPDMATELKTKEEELERLRGICEEMDKNYKKLREQHDELIRKDKEKLVLPPLRLKPEEQELRKKEEQKAELDEYVKQLRAARKMKESEQSLVDKNKLPALTPNYTSTPISNGTSKQSFDKSNIKQPTSTGSTLRPISQDISPTSTLKFKDENTESPRSNLLKRSHSHPNLAQQSLTEDNEILESQNSAGGTPNVNRSLKPTSVRPMASEAYGARRREFQVVSSTEKQKTGLKNLGNTCYMNSVIQCIYHTTFLASYFKSDDYKEYCRLGHGPTRGEATEEVAAVVREMDFGHRSIALNDLKSVVGKYRPAFSGYDQQDSHEFLTFLLDWMHEELNHVRSKNPLKEQKNDGISDAEASELAWNDYTASNKSKISELFCGQQKSCVKCLSCDKESVTFEPFFILSVPIPSSSKKCDIQQCIELYTSAEELSGFNCVHCKTTGKASKKIDLWKLPPYLIIHLQRFYYDGWWKKRLAEVEFPVDCLDLSTKVKGDHRLSNCQLYGVSNHYGTMDGGHYTAYCRKGFWYKFDDHSVEQIGGKEVCTAAAYILFYSNQ